MRVSLLVFFVFTLCFKLSYSQQLTYERVDDLTYTQYTNAEWKNLLKTGKEALKNNIDYNNLRMRIGYANFQLKNYSASLKHYNKSLKFNSYNPWANYYVAFNNLYLNRKRVSNISCSWFRHNYEKGF